MTQPNTSNSLHRMRALLLIVVFCGLRVLYLPLHLAQEEHLVAGPVPHSHESTAAGHDDGYEHHAAHGEKPGDEEHIPHPVDDHASEMLLPRAPLQDIPVDGPVLVQAERLGVTPENAYVTGAVSAVLRPPRSRVPTTRYLRGPPSAS